MTELEISQEFIDENNLCQHRPKTSPHTRTERKKRQDEVFKLHFEYGYSARKIADMMKINRNTINSDITFWYSKLRIESNKETYSDWTTKQLSRLESQRTRLRKELDSELTFQERLQVEKMLLDLDSRISNLVIKLETSRQVVWDYAVQYINSWMEKQGHKDRYMTQSNLHRIPEKSREKIYRMLGQK